MADRNASIFAIGIGVDWNEPLLNMVTERTRGRAFVVLPDSELQGNPIAVAASGFASLLSTEFNRAALEVVTGVVAHLRLVRDFILNRVTRVFPALTEISCESGTLALGNVGAIEQAVFVLELSIPARPPGRVRFMQGSFVYDVPGAGYRGELGPIDVLVEFSTDEARSSVTDDDVFAYVRQRNCDGLIVQAVSAFDRGDTARATVLINRAKNMTQRVGNSALTVLLGRVESELNSGKTISPQSRKTLLVGSKSKTVRVGDSAVGGLSDEEIRRLTGA
jgi:Ca-activated chloride channel family protein